MISVIKKKKIKKSISRPTVTVSLFTSQMGHFNSVGLLMKKLHNQLLNDLDSNTHTILFLNDSDSAICLLNF